METYLSPVETHCTNVNYFIPDEENETRSFTEDAMTRLRKAFLFTISDIREFMCKHKIAGAILFYLQASDYFVQF